MRKPIFVTGNEYKAEKLSKLLGIQLEHQKLELDEIQSRSVEAVVEHKARQAFQQVDQPVLVEDTALEIMALGGLPGPFIKFFVAADGGNEMICRMLDGFSERSALATSVFAYYDGDSLELIRGDHAGVIAKHPVGGGGYGWDAIFVPDGFGGKTSAQLDEKDYNKVYSAIKDFGSLHELLKEE